MRVAAARYSLTSNFSIISLRKGFMIGSQKNNPNANTAINGRLLGQILVDGEFISHHDLDRALKEQKETNSLLGEVLIRMEVLEPIDLKAALSVQRHLGSLGEAIRAAAGVRQLLGNLLIQARRITHEQLDCALREQRRTGEKLGAVLVRLGMLTAGELDAVLSFQQNQGDMSHIPAPFKLGEILVATNLITREQLLDALSKQISSQKKLGDILVESGHLDPHHIDQGLKLQQRLLTAALVAVLSLSSLHCLEAADQSAPAPGRTRITVTATVRAHTALKVIHQTPHLVVTHTDIIRGFVEVPLASEIEVTSNSPAGYLMVFEGLGIPFKEVYIQGLGNEVQVTSGGCWIPQPYSRGKVMLELSYRFILAEDTRPGTYTWPLMISARSL